MDNNGKEGRSQSFNWFFSALTSRIAWSFIVAVAVSIIAVQSFVAYISYQQFQQNRIFDAQLEGLSIVKTLLVMNDNNFKNPDKITRFFATDTILEGAKIYDLDNNLLLSFGQVEGLNSQEALVDNHWLDVAWQPNDLQLPYRVIARLDFSQAPTNYSLFAKIEAQTAVVQIVFLLLVICFIVSRIFLKPLLKIKNQLQKASNDPAHPGQYQLSYQQQNEIGTIVYYLNELLAKQQSYVQLNQQKQKETALLPDESTYPIVRISAEGKVVYFNRSSTVLFEDTPKIGSQVVEAWRHVGTDVLEHGKTKAIEWEHNKSIYLLTFVPISEQNYINIYAFDISLRKQYEEKIDHMSNHDLVTELPNLTLFQNLLHQFAQSAQKNNTKVAIIAFSIRNYDAITKTLGSDGSSLLLQRISRRMDDFLSSKIVAGHLLNNEFVMAITDINDLAEISRFVGRLKAAFEGSYEIYNETMNIRFLFGITVYPDDGVQVESLISNASIALYYASNDSQSFYRFFAKQMNEKMERRNKILSALTFAIERDELEMYYQPQYNLVSHEICGVEALLRWDHPELGAISPAEFIPLAEGSGEIVKLTQWVLKNCIHQLSVWKELSDLTISVNLSMVDFDAESMIKLLRELFDEYNVSANRIELEITETALTENIDIAKKGLTAIRDIGVPIAIDDFGTGYCSMQYLQDFPVDKIKIDSAFVQALEMQERSRAIVTSIIHLAHGLGLALLAEGVETQEQADILLSLGCDHIQGYYYSKPLPAGAFEKLGVQACN